MKPIENSFRYICNKTLEREFCSVYKRCKGMIERKAFYLTNSKQQIEDIAQEVFLKLWLKWPVLNMMPAHELENYMYAMVKNHILNIQKRQASAKNAIGYYVEIQADRYSPDEIIVTEGFKIYAEAIDQLPPKEKEVYLLYNNDFDRLKIANRMRTSKNTINNQLHSASRSVKDYLQNKLDLNFRCEGRKKT